MSKLDLQKANQIREKQKVILPPRRPLSAYFLYLADIREDLIAKNPNTSVADVSRLAGAKWRTCDPKTRSKYQKKAEEIRERYEIEKAEYEERFGRINKPGQTAKGKRKPIGSLVGRKSFN